MEECHTPRLQVTHKAGANKSVSLLKKTFSPNKVSINQLDPEKTMTRLGILFTGVMALTGIKGILDEAIKRDISNMMLNFFNQLSIEEVELAFEMERYSQFEDKTEHFQEFNSDYVSKILKKYIIWKRNTSTQLNISNAKHEDRQPTEEELDAINQEYIKSIYNELNTGIESYKINAHLIYDKIPEKFKPSAAEMWQIFEEQKQIYETEIKSKQIKYSSNKIKLKEIIQNANNSALRIVQDRCRSIVVCNWILNDPPK